MSMNGTIRKREARDVVRDLLEREKVSKSTYQFTPKGVLNILVGSRQVTINIPRGLTFYGVNDLLRRVQAAIDEQRIIRDKRQIDLEDAIKSAEAKP